jgi:hypothetical protein
MGVISLRVRARWIKRATRVYPAALVMLGRQRGWVKGARRVERHDLVGCLVWHGFE